MSATIITAVVNCHNEGRLAWRSFLSAWEAISAVPTADMLIVLDSPDAETKGCAEDFCTTFDGLSSRRVRILTTHHSDLGLARNSAVLAARGEYIAFLDGDDIWGNLWLVYALAYLESVPVQSIAHPQVNINFEQDQLWWEHKDSRAKDFDPSVLLVTNHWTALALAHRSVFEQHPYTAAGNGYGFEDWEWNTRTLAAKIPHVVVPETVHFIRRSASSMSKRQGANGVCVRANNFFDTRPIAFDPGFYGEPAQLALGDWLTLQWKAAHQAEPELWPNQRELASRPKYAHPPAGAVFDVYNRIRAVVPDDATHLIFFAGLGGGADLRAYAYADAVIAAGGKPALLATDGKSKGRDGHDTYELASALSALGSQEQSRAVQRLMLQFVDRATFHIINSRIAWQALAQNTEPFKGKIFASLYAYEANPNGAVTGYAANGALTAGMQALRAVITDNDFFRRELKARTGWVRTIVAPTPMSVNGITSKSVGPDRIVRVLVAGRVDWNKNLDFVFELAVRCLAKGEKLMFDVVGESADYHGFCALAKLKAMPNVKTRGAFSSFAALSPSTFDVLVLPSHKEGMPNVALEAMSYGLPVVCSAVGGLSDCAVDGFPGRVVKGFDPAEWVERIKEASKLSYNSAKWLRDRHSRVGFESALRGAGYFETCAKKLAEVAPSPPERKPESGSSHDASGDAQPTQGT